MSIAPAEQKTEAGAPDFNGLIRWLLRQATLADKDSRARTALAELRRGLRDDPRDRLIVGKYVVPFLGEEPRTDWQHWQEQCCYLVAALFASHPTHKSGVSLGWAMKQVRDKRGGGQRREDDKKPNSIEPRFLNLVATRPERLRMPLRQIIGLLKANDVPLDWGKLLEDLCAWDHPEKPVQQRWARHFYKGPHDPELDRLDTMNGDTNNEN